MDGLVRDVLRTFEFGGLAQTPLIQSFFLFPILFIPILVIKTKSLCIWGLVMVTRNRFQVRNTLGVCVWSVTVLNLYQWPSLICF